MAAAALPLALALVLGIFPGLSSAALGSAGSRCEKDSDCLSGSCVCPDARVTVHTSTSSTTALRPTLGLAVGAALAANRATRQVGLCVIGGTVVGHVSAAGALHCVNAGDEDGPFTCTSEGMRYDPENDGVKCPRSGCTEAICCTKEEVLRQQRADAACKCAPALDDGSGTAITTPTTTTPEEPAVTTDAADTTAPAATTAALAEEPTTAAPAAPAHSPATTAAAFRATTAATPAPAPAATTTAVSCALSALSAP